MLQNSINFPVKSSPDKRSINSDDLMCEIGKVLQAAVINKNFREQLLDNPLRSIESGYFGETFHIPSEILKSISLLKSSNLEHFTQSVLLIVDSIRIPEMAEVSAY
jgi:hypothetical protein